jgi:signal transduction histidine kinase
VRDLPDLLGDRAVCDVITEMAIWPKMRMFAGSDDQVRHARDFVERVLNDCPIASDATLLTSELVTNAILHTASGLGGKFTVTVSRTGNCVRIEVADDGSGTSPHPRPHGRDGESGFGLSLVELIARRWGYDGGTPGRVVWFELEW